MAHAADNSAPLSPPETHLASFVVRFVCDQPVEPGPPPATHWYGVLRHIQSNVELHFTHWEAAVAFIAQHVDLTAGRDP